jgi:hypothetical protein
MPADWNTNQEEMKEEMTAGLEAKIETNKNQ